MTESLNDLVKFYLNINDDSTEEEKSKAQLLELALAKLIDEQVQNASKENEDLRSKLEEYARLIPLVNRSQEEINHLRIILDQMSAHLQTIRASCSPFKSILETKIIEVDDPEKDDTLPSL